MANDDWFEGRRWSLFHGDEEAMERCYWRRVGFVMFAAVALAVIILPLLLGGCATITPPPQPSKSAYDGPPMVTTDGKGNSIRLTKAPCPNVSGWLSMSAAEMVFEGKQYKACWVMVGTVVLVFDSNGDATPIPAQAFKPETQV